MPQNRPALARRPLRLPARLHQYSRAAGWRSEATLYWSTNLRWTTPCAYESFIDGPTLKVYALYIPLP
jgi:hypothetical protein